MQLLDIYLESQSQTQQTYPTHNTVMCQVSPRTFIHS